MKKAELKDVVECKDCLGEKICRRCNGDGWLMSLRPTAKNGIEDCDGCNGTGRCPWCDSEGEA